MEIDENWDEEENVNEKVIYKVHVNLVDNPSIQMNVNLWDIKLVDHDKRDSYRHHHHRKEYSSY